MKKVSIVSSTAPAKPRSDKYPVGASVTRTSSGTTVVNQGGGESIDIVKKDDIKSFTDKNVLSSLRSVAEFISKKDDSQISAIAAHFQYSSDIYVLVILQRIIGYLGRLVNTQ